MTNTEQLLENALTELLTLQKTTQNELLARLENLEKENRLLAEKYNEISQQLADLTPKIDSLNKTLMKFR